VIDVRPERADAMRRDDSLYVSGGDIFIPA
jgi:hypothetical protein